MQDIQNKSAADNTPGTKKQRVIADYLGGMTCAEVAAKYGVTHGTMQVNLWRWGVKLSDDERARRRAEACRKSAEIRSGPRWSYVWPDCPTHLREDYQTLRRYMTAREARATLEGQECRHSILV